MKRTERFTKFLAANWRLKMPRSLKLQENNPGRCMHVRTKWRQRAALYLIEIGNKSKRFAHRVCWIKLLREGVYFGRPGRFRFLRSIREHSELYECSTTCWLSPTAVCLRCRALIGRHLLCCLVQGACAVLAAGSRRRRAPIYKKPIKLIHITRSSRQLSD